MEYNESTRNRPEGERMLNNRWLKIDLNQFTAELQSEEWRKNDRKSITVFKNEHITLVLMLLKGNAYLPPHDAEGTFSIQVLEGLLEMELEGREVALDAGQMVAVNKGCRYSITATQLTLALLTQAHID